MHQTAKIKSYLLYNSVSSYRMQLKSCQSAHSFLRYGPLFFNVSQFLLQDAWRKKTKRNRTYTNPNSTVCPCVRTHQRPDCSYAYGISVLSLVLMLQVCLSIVVSLVLKLNEHTRRSLTVCPCVRTHLRSDCSYA